MAKITNISQVTSKYELPDQSIKGSDVKSNESSTENMTTSFIKLRTSAKDYGEPNEEIEQTITLTNNSEYTITSINIKDTIGAGATFKAGSVTINEESKPNEDIVTGINLEDITASGVTIIKYLLVVDASPTVERVDSYSTITYSVNETTDLEENSNTTNLNLSKNMIVITKTSDKSVVIKGQKIKFQNVITNTGNLKNTDVEFKDPIPEGTTFVNGSVMVNGVVQGGSNPSVGFKIDDLEPNATVTVTFEVTVD